MITNYEGLTIKTYANAINFMKSEKIIMQLIVKKYSLPNGQSGVCLYSTHSDGKEYFIRKDKPTVNIVKDNECTVVLVDCKAGTFNIAVQCDDEEAVKLMNDLNAAINKLWEYRNSEIKKLFNKKQVKHHVKTDPIPEGFTSAIKKLRRLIKNGNFTKNKMEESLTISGLNCINSIISLFEEQYDKNFTNKLSE